MKDLLSAVAFTLILSAFAIPATTYAKGIGIGAKVIHIDGSNAIPQNASARSATFKIDVHVEGKSLSSLAITIPEEISVGGVEVMDGSGKTVETITTIKDKKIAIAFTNPVAPESHLQVRLNGVSNRWHRSNTWMFPMSAQVGGMSGYLPLGLALIHTYSN
jgi:hypothetical protein